MAWRCDDLETVGGCAGVFHRLAKRRLAGKSAGLRQCRLYWNPEAFYQCLQAADVVRVGVGQQNGCRGEVFLRQILVQGRQFAGGESRVYDNAVRAF